MKMHLTLSLAKLLQQSTELRKLSQCEFYATRVGGLVSA